MSVVEELDVFRCRLDGINLIEASAGTGKTWNICGLYLRFLLERELEVQRILVVTFTNAATAELRERIRGRILATLQHLKAGSAASDDPFVAPLLDELVVRQGRDPEGLLNRLELALESFDEAAIFTIHGFCQRALADNPFAAGLPMSMELVRDDADWRLQAVHDFWRRHLAGDIPTPSLVASLKPQRDTPEGHAALLKRHLAKPLAINLWPHGLDAAGSLDASPLEAIYAEAAAEWRARREEIAERLIEALSQLNGTTYNAARVRAGAQDWDAYFRAGSALAEPGDKCRIFRADTLAERTKNKCVTPKHPFFDQAEACLAARDAFSRELTHARLRLIRALLHEAGDGLRELKRAQRVVSFDDMLANLHQRLHGDAGNCGNGLASALKTRFPAALIDEFQDTDPLQFAIFQRIYGGGDASLFLVGDPKQAIYSFRHADLHTYLGARRFAGREYSLVANQRAGAGLLTALNKLFGANPAAFMLPGLDYRPAALGSKPRQRFHDSSATGAELRIWKLHDSVDDVPDRKAARRDVAAATAAEIARLIDAARAGQVSLGDRHLGPGDIAVLVRSHAQGSEIKRALAQLGVGSVELSQASVYQSVEAEEVERLMRAILEPARDGLVRAALATELLGRTAAEVAAIGADEARLAQCLGQFNQLRETWHKHGFGVMYRRLLNSEQVARRMLARADGERRLTNYLHLGECLHQAAETHASPDALLRFMESRRREGTSDESAQLRLESDRNLVQIVTIHKSKGLEYPVVFCPYLWDDPARPGGFGLEGVEYHDADGRPVIDWRGDEIEDAENTAIKQQTRLESAAEFMRLIYVALTRAVHRCYLVAGCYTAAAGRQSASVRCGGLLNWLACGAGEPATQWLNGGSPAPARILAGWEALADGEHIALAPLPRSTGKPIAAEPDAPGSFFALAPPAVIPDAWRVSSYSGLSRGALTNLSGPSGPSGPSGQELATASFTALADPERQGERPEAEPAASDHDARIPTSPAQAPASLAADDILRFPRGAAAGDCIHAVFEHLDFTEPETWSDAIANALAAFPQRLPRVPEREQVERLGRMLEQMLRDVTETDLGEGLRLNSVPLNRRLTELEFNLPAHALTAGGLNQTLKSFGYAGPRLTFNALRGYLKGFIDLVFEHQGRYYILDWKSNHLGFDAAAYQSGPLAEAMAEHGYHLQYLLYSVALDRFLRRRIPDYHYANHFGGVFYLFVRGVRPDWRAADGSPCGVYRHRPAADTIERLNALLDATHDF